MIKNISTCSVVFLLLSVISGCNFLELKPKMEVPYDATIDGEVFEGRIDKEMEEIMKVTKHVLSLKGNIVSYDLPLGRIEVAIGPYDVTATILQVERDYGLLRIKAIDRHDFRANLEFSELLFEEINRELTW